MHFLQSFSHDVKTGIQKDRKHVPSSSSGLTSQPRSAETRSAWLESLEFQPLFSFSFFFFFFCLFAISLAAPVAYGDSQARGRIGAVAYSRATATRDPSRVFNLHHSSRPRQIVNPLSKVRDRTHNLMVLSRIH